MFIQHGLSLKLNVSETLKATSRVHMVSKQQVLEVLNDEPRYKLTGSVVLHTNSGDGTMWASGPPNFSTVWAWPTHFWRYFFFCLSPQRSVM